MDFQNIVRSLERFGLMLPEVVRDVTVDDSRWKLTDGRGPTPEEASRMTTYFHSLLADAFKSVPARCEPIAGGSELIAELSRRKIAFAIATGGLRSTSLLKLRAAGYQMPETPIATASDATNRTEICKLAVVSISPICWSVSFDTAWTSWMLI